VREETTSLFRENHFGKGATMRQWKRHAAVAILAIMGVVLGPAHGQMNYPTRPVRIVVAFAPGGIADVLARVIGQKLSARFDQTFVVENRSGAGGSLGAKVVSSSPADGYTLLVTTSALAINAVAMKNSVDPRSQLTAVAMIATAPMVFVASKDVTSPNLGVFVRDVKKGRFTYSTAGVGTAEHLTSEYIYKTASDLDATHVPFSGGLEAVNAVLGHAVDLASATVPSALSLIKSGNLHILAVASHDRLASLPNVPTLKEAGFADVAAASWIGVFGPPGLPSPIAEKLNGEINAALGQPDIDQKLAGLGFVAQPQSQKAFTDNLNSEIERWGEIVRTVGFAPN